MRSARGLARLARRLGLGPPPPRRHSGLLGRALAELGYHGTDLRPREVAAFFSCSLRTARRAMTYARRGKGEFTGRIGTYRIHYALVVEPAPEVRHG